jgi:type I restriction enzyme S subunit
MIAGDYPVYGGNGINGHHNEYFLEEPTVVIGRVGAYCGSILITQPKAWVTDNGLYVKEYLYEIEVEFLAQMLRQLNINQYAKVGGQPSISQSTILELKVPLPDLLTQKELVNKLRTVDSYVGSNREIILLFEQKIKDRIAKVWGL